jgi:hypothetical protein
VREPQRAVILNWSDLRRALILVPAAHGARAARDKELRPQLQTGPGVSPISNLVGSSQQQVSVEDEVAMDVHLLAAYVRSPAARLFAKCSPGRAACNWPHRQSPLALF